MTRDTAAKTTAINTNSPMFTISPADNPDATARDNVIASRAATTTQPILARVE
jgi:hypothetical protein